MRLLAASRTVVIPDGVTLEVKGRKARVVGPRGTNRWTRAVNFSASNFAASIAPRVWRSPRRARSTKTLSNICWADCTALSAVTRPISTHRAACHSPRTGTLSRDLSHLALDIYVTKNEQGQSIVKVDCHSGKKIKIAQIRTACSHIQNMITGVTLGFKTMMRLVYAHFPININVTKGGECVEIRNFLGEKRVRVVNMLAGCKIERSEAVKDELIISGNDIELVNRSAAMVHDICTFDCPHCLDCMPPRPPPLPHSLAPPQSRSHK